MNLLEAVRNGKVQQGTLGFRPVGRRFAFYVDPMTETLTAVFEGRGTPVQMNLEILLSEYELVERE